MSGKPSRKASDPAAAQLMAQDPVADLGRGEAGVGQVDRVAVPVVLASRVEIGAWHNNGMLPERLAARVILLDPDCRVLLMRYGEEYRDGALRELAEETGWTDIPLLDEVLRRELTMEYAGRLVRQRERLYLARTTVPEREIRGVEAMHASDHIAAWRWWTLAELETTAEKVWPRGLPTLVRDALAASA
jgi:hypothetical protein